MRHPRQSAAAYPLGALAGLLDGAAQGQLSRTQARLALDTVDSHRHGLEKGTANQRPYGCGMNTAAALAAIPLMLFQSSSHQ